MIPQEYIELRFGPSWKYISLSREFIQKFIYFSLQNKPKADLVSMAVTELLENAVKYSNGEVAHVIIQVLGNEKIHINVMNTTDSRNAETLKELFNRISAGDPLESFVREMKAVSGNDDKQSHLGLARIRYEAKAELSLDISIKNQVSITCVI